MTNKTQDRTAPKTANRSTSSSKSNAKVSIPKARTTLDRYDAMTWILGPLRTHTNMDIPSSAQAMCNALASLEVPLFSISSIGLFIYFYEERLLRYYTPHDRRSLERERAALMVPGHYTQDWKSPIHLNAKKQNEWFTRNKEFFEEKNVSLLIPLRSGSGFLGVLGLNKSDETPFTKDEIAFYEALAGSLGFFLESSFTQERANKDTITHLYHHSYFLNLNGEMLDRMRREGVPGSSFGLLNIDPDDFMNIVHDHGSDVAEAIIRELGFIIDKCGVRDIRYCSRYGADKFLVALPDIGPDQVFFIANRLRKEVEDYPFPGAETPIKMTISISCFWTSNYQESLDQVIEMTTLEIRRAKLDGKNTVVMVSANQELKTEYVVNLKVSDRVHTIEQLISTIEQHGVDFSEFRITEASNPDHENIRLIMELYQVLVEILWGKEQKDLHRFHPQGSIHQIFEVISRFFITHSLGKNTLYLVELLSQAQASVQCLILCAIENFFRESESEKTQKGGKLTEEQYAVFQGVQGHVSFVLTDLLAEKKDPGIIYQCLRIAWFQEYFLIPDEWLDFLSIEWPEVIHIELLRLVQKQGLPDQQLNASKMLLANGTLTTQPCWTQLEWLRLAEIFKDAYLSEATPILESAIESQYAIVRRIGLRLLHPSFNNVKKYLRYIEDEDLTVRYYALLEITKNFEFLHPMLIAQLVTASDNELILYATLDYISHAKKGTAQLAHELLTPNFLRKASNRLRIKVIQEFLPLVPDEKHWEYLNPLAQFAADDIHEALEMAERQFNGDSFCQHLLEDLEHAGTENWKKTGELLRYTKVSPKMSQEIANKLEDQSLSHASRMALIRILGWARVPAAVKALKIEIQDLGLIRQERDRECFRVNLEALSSIGSKDAIKTLMAQFKRVDLTESALKFQIVEALLPHSLSDEQINEFMEFMMMRKDYASPLCRNVSKVLWANPLPVVEDYMTKVSRGKDSALKQILAEEFPQNPNDDQQALCYSFLVNNNERRFDEILLGRLKREGSDLSQSLLELVSSKDTHVSPLSQLVDHLDKVIDDVEKRYFMDRVFPKSDMDFKGNLTEYYLTHSIESFLEEYFNHRQLSDLLEKSGTDPKGSDLKDMVQKLLRGFHFQSPVAPCGIHATETLINHLFREIEKDDDSWDDLKRNSFQIALEIERLVRELVVFYSIILFGEEKYYSQLKHLTTPEDRASFDRPSFGTWCTRLRLLMKECTGGHKKVFEERFGRSQMLDKSIFQELEVIVLIRNKLAHPGEGSAESLRSRLVDEFPLAIGQVLGMFTEESVFPTVISPNRYIQNHYGVAYWECQMDAPKDDDKVLRIITDRDLELRYSYFLHPRDLQTSSSILYPTLIPREKYL